MFFFQPNFIGQAIKFLIFLVHILNLKHQLCNRLKGALHSLIPLWSLPTKYLASILIARYIQL